MTGTLSKEIFLFLFITSSLSVLRITIFFRQKLQRKSKPAFYFYKLFYGNRAVREIMWKNIIRINAYCILDTEDYKHTLRICNTYCFSTATMVARTRFNVTL